MRHAVPRSFWPASGIHSRVQLGTGRGRALLAASLLLYLGCSAEEPTEIVAGVSTQIQVPDYLRSVGLVVQAEGEVIFCDSYPVTDGRTTLPATLGVLGATGRGTLGTVTVQVLGLRTESSEFDEDCVFTRAEAGEDDNREVMVIRRRRLSFVDGRILYLPLPLKESCRDQGCGPEETCVGGLCVTMDIEASTLPDYQARLLFGSTNTCFDGAQCMPSGGTLPALLEDPNTCTFRVQWPDALPQPGPGDLNVRMVYDTLGTEILDVDAVALADEQREGFSFPSVDDPLTFRLAPNLCQSNYKADRVLAVEASALCPGKRSLQPMCDSYTPPNPRAPEDDDGMLASGVGAGLCTLAALEPVESIVYVLMDRSQRMYPFYGAGGLRFAVELPLASPVARRTRIAFGPLPAAPAECGTDAYASPQVPFGSASDVRQPIADILSAPGSVLPDNPVAVSLEAALRGAYAAVATTPSLGGDGFGQRAVLVISNRDISEGACAVGPNAVQLAAAAASGPNPISTYAVALGDPNDNDPAADASTVASATALATAGGTEVFDGVADAAESATAVVDILTELGTCLYAVKRVDLGIDGANALPDTALLSYVNPLSPSNSAVDIALNRACNDDASPDVSGWNREGERVRVCGQACADLRSVISGVTGLHLLEERSAPPTPVVVSAPCEEFVLRAGL